GTVDERAEGEQDLRAKIAEMPTPDRVMAERIHELVTEAAPSLVPKTYYGMPAYAKDGKVICFFQAASKFKVRYATFGFQPDARVDDGEMWPVAFAVSELTPRSEAQLVELVKKAIR
ncbi:MAG: iron chaperone, partial [Chloroflexota bacterium]